jgi:hypothetical protein
MTQPNSIQTTYGSVFVTQPIVSDDQLATKLYVDNSKVSAVDDAKVYTDQEISALVAGAPEALNTLKELADALGSGDVASSITQQLATVTSNLTAESEARGEKDTELENSIGANVIAINDLTEAMTAQQNATALLEDNVGVNEVGITAAAAAIDAVNITVSDLQSRLGEAENNIVLGSEDVSLQLSEKFDKSGGDLSGSVKVPSAHYLYIGDNWRLAAVGNSMEFQYSATPEVEDTFVHGCPLVFSE